MIIETLVLSLSVIKYILGDIISRAYISFEGALFRLLVTAE